MDDKEKNVRKIDISVEQWHELALEGIYTSVTLKLDGESMSPLIRKQRDSVTVHPLGRKLKKGDIVLFVRNDGVYVIHRVYKIKGDEAITIGDDCVEFDAPVLNSSIWGLAVRLERNGKIINLDSIVSRIYGIVRMSTRHIRRVWKKLIRFGVKIIKRMVGRS